MFGGGGGGSITAIAADSITVKSPAGGTRTILTTAKTVYTEAMAVVQRSDLKVGQNVGVLVKPVAPPAGSTPNWGRPAAPSAPASTGSTTSSVSSTTEPTALAIEIVLPSLQGRVVSVSSNEIVVEGFSGLRQTLITTGSTTYRELNTTVSALAVRAGESVVGFGAVAANHKDLDASTVAVVGPLSGGKVTGVSGSTITVQSPRGTVKISTNSSTIFTTSAGTSSLAGVKTGDFVLAVGLQSGTTGFTASGIWFGMTAGAAGAPGIGLGFPGLGASFGAGGSFGAGFHGASGRPGAFGHFGQRPGTTPGSAGSSGGSSSTSGETTT